MKGHLNDGQLRAALDGEITPFELHHLEDCPICQARQSVLQIQLQSTTRKLSFLASTVRENAPSARAALRHFYDQILPQKETSMFKKLFTSPILRFGLPIVLLLVLIISIPGTRALASQLLDLFRVQQVTVVPVDFTGMQQLTGNNALGKQISEMISSSITMKQKPADPVDAVDAADASQKAGFTVRLPQEMTPARLSVLKASAFDFTIDRTKAQALLDEAGRSDLTLPASVDGAVISVDIPASVSIAYGTCPTPSTDKVGVESDESGSPGRKYPDCIILFEIPSPTVSAPADVNVAQLAQIGLEFTGMTSDQAAAFTQTVDWTSTLVVPIPRNAVTYQQVSVDGVTGTLIQRPVDDAPQYVLLWVKDGILYSIGGLGSDSQKTIQMANSLP